MEIDDILKEAESVNSKVKKSNKKRIIRRGKKIISLSMAGLLAYSLASTAPEVIKEDNIYAFNILLLNEEESEYLYSQLEEKTGKDTRYNDSTLILTAAMKNENLTEEEKQRIYKLIDLIEDNPYINKREAYNALKKLDIIYVEDEEHNPSIMGVYLANDNIIKIYKDDEKGNTLNHELVHCLFANVNTDSLPTYFSEGMTELLVNEYFSENPFFEEKSYPYEITAVKILCDMVGSDTVLKAYTTGDIQAISNELKKIMTSEEVDSFLYNTEAMFERFTSGGRVSKAEINRYLAFTDSYFLRQERESFPESYSYNRELISLMKEESPNIEYVFHLSEVGYYVKPYFSSSLRAKYKTDFLCNNTEEKEYQKKY